MRKISMNISDAICNICSALSHRSRVDVPLALLTNADEGMRTGNLSEVTGLPPLNIVLSFARNGTWWSD